MYKQYLYVTSGQNEMWSEYTMYSSMYDNNLYFKYKCSQYVAIRQIWACHTDNIMRHGLKSSYICHMAYKYYLYGMPIFDVVTHIANICT